MTVKAVATIAGSAATLLVAVLAQRWFVALFSVPLLLPLFASLLYVHPSEKHIVAERVVPRSNFVAGDTVRVEISVRNVSNRSVVLEVREKLGEGLRLVGGDTVMLSVLKPHQEKRFTYYVTADRRGHYDLGPLEVYSLDPFLFTRVKVKEYGAERLTFFPKIRRIDYIPMPAARTTLLPGEAMSNAPGEGFEFMEVGEARGSGLRRINWKATAKTGRPMVNVYLGERSAECLIVLDVPSSRLLGRALTEVLVDKMVEYTGSLAYYLTRRGNRVSLLVVGHYRDWVKPGFGKRHFLRILHSLADVKSLETKTLVDYSEVFSRVAPFLAKSRSLVFIVSTFTEKAAFEILGEAERSGYVVRLVAINPFNSVAEHCEKDKLEPLKLLSDAWEYGLPRVLSRGSPRTKLLSGGG
ncbi:DUF58 domain-containing protein [Thermofilum pendens]|uniref:DUF58 domain-containing protein n=1 Tax=Thermofilum pendens (strain DSM 2475 / Hrk 5) TaxID=368408 RepID=A1RWJ5_THEPD|nr:DUF58 domain-containing protein [Thermofilum pendens]ABL77575.1 protein of unknown function DUF58 [Thermofilum pendens Hrk 5]